MNSSSSESGSSPSHNRSFPFSISDILSDEVGQKKSPTSHLGISFSTPSSNSSTGRPPFSKDKTGCGNLETPKRPRKDSSSHMSARPPQITLVEAGSMIVSSASPAYTGYHESLKVHSCHGPCMVTPHKPPHSSSHNLNTSLISPFNTEVLMAIRHRPSPSSEEREELFGESSLGMLSEVAQLHGELSEAETDSAFETPVREKLANIRLVSSSDICEDGSHESSKGESYDASQATHPRKILTPSILKRDKKRRRQSSGSSALSSSGDECNTLSRRSQNPGFLSPLANEKSSLNKKLDFSPSIFLSRPDHTMLSSSSSDHSHNPVSSPPLPIPVPKSESNANLDSDQKRPSTDLGLRLSSTSPGSESDCPHSLLDSGESGTSFITSTPIKSGGKENVRRKSETEEWSPTILLNKRRRHLRETNETSSESDSETLKKPRPGPLRKKSKARTKLSPLLENACSPISKDSSHHPSPLASAQATTPTRGVASNLPYQVLPGPNPVVTGHPLLSAPTADHIQLPSQAGPVQISKATPTSYTAGNFPLAPKQLSPTSIQPITLSRSFPPPATRFLALSSPQVTQAHQSLLQQQSVLSQLQASLPFNPLASMCNAPALQGYTNMVSNTPAFPGYFPLVSGLMPPPPAGTYLQYNPYSPKLMTFGSSSGGGSSTDSSGRSTNSLDEGGKQIQSVPPWFIFSNNRSEKRSRLTDAINKSLSETPSQTKKLPAEWTKLACGQTHDQKLLTEEARIFMQCRPRQLTFDEEEMD